MKIGWTLAPRRSRSRCWGAASCQAIFESYPVFARRRVPRPAARRRRALDPSAPKPLEGGGMAMNIVDVDWRSPRCPVQNIVQHGPRRRGRARAQRARGGGGARAWREYWYRFHAGDEVTQIGRTKTRRRPACRSIVCGFAVCGCQHYEDGYFTRSGGSRGTVRLRLTPATTSTKGAPMAGKERPPLPSAQQRRDLPLATTGTATPCTRETAT